MSASRFVAAIAALMLLSVPLFADDFPCAREDRDCLLGLVTENPSPWRMRAAMWLGDFPEPETAALLAAQLADEDRMMATAALDGLIRMGEAGAKALVAKVEDPLPRVRAYAVYGLAQIGSGYTSADVMVAASDSESKVRRHLVDAAKPLGAEGIAILEALSHDRAIHVRYKAVEALGALDDPRIVPILAQSMYDLYPRVGNEATAALVRKGGAAVPELRRLLRSGKEYAILRACAALSAIGDAHANPELVRLLGARDPEVVAAAIHVLSITGDRLSLPALRNLRDPGRKVKGVRLGDYAKKAAIAIEDRLREKEK